MAEIETFAWTSAEPAPPATAAERSAAPYLRSVPRHSSRARVELICRLLRRFGRLHLREAVRMPALRERLRRVDQWVFHPPRWARYTPVLIGDVPCDWIETASSRSDRVLLYLHGGGFAFHMPRGYRSFAARLSRALQARVLLVDYRLAPEHRYPAAPDDAFAVYRGLLDQGVSPEHVIVAGDSAGGHLTLGLLQRLQREGLHQPGCAIALSPITDGTLSGASMVTQTHADPLLDPPSLRILRDLVYPARLPFDAVASPLHGRLEGLPPTLLVCGTREVLLDDARRYAQRAHAAGSPVALEVWEDMPHVFPLMAQLSESKAVIEHLARFVDTTLA